MADREKTAEVMVVGALTNVASARVLSYLQSGRSLVGEDLESLERRFVGAARAAASTLEFQELDDALSEYEIRDIQPPYDLVQVEFATIAAMSEKASANRGEQITRSLVDDAVADRLSPKH